MSEHLTGRAKELLSALPLEIWTECSDGQILLDLARHGLCTHERVNSTLGRFESLEWRPLELAPSNGEWLLVDVDDGSNDCNNEGEPWRPTRRLGRRKPHHCSDVGVTYDWEVLEPDGNFNHYATERVVAWQPLPHS